MLGDEDEEEEDGPPGYEDVVIGGGSEAGSRKGSSLSEEASGAPNTADDADSSVREPLKHRIQKGETIRSIANRYAMDVSPLPFPYLPSQHSYPPIAVYIDQAQRPTIYSTHQPSHRYPDPPMDHIGTFRSSKWCTAAIGCDRGWG